MPPSHKTADNDDEEDDYMSMIIQEPATQQRETLTQRKLRKQREVSPSSSISQASLILISRCSQKQKLGSPPKPKGQLPKPRAAKMR